MTDFLSTAAVQISYNFALTGVVMISLGIAIVGFLYHNHQRNKTGNQDNTRIAVKIDRRGNYRYETIPDTDQDYVSLFWKIILVLAAIALIFFPLDAFLNRS